MRGGGAKGYSTYTRFGVSPSGPTGSEKLTYLVCYSKATPPHPLPPTRSLGKPQQYLGLQSGFDWEVFTNKIRGTLLPQTHKILQSAPAGCRFQTPGS